jgi:hypothetical protein
VADDLKVMIQHDRSPAASDNPLMTSDLLAAVEDHDLGRAQRDPHLPADQASGDGVLRHPDRHQPGPVDPRVQDQPGIEPLGRQRAHQGSLVGENVADGATALADPALLVAGIPATDLRVELGEGIDLRHG